MARRRPRAQETRQRILDAALQAFSTRGYHAVSIEDIAAAAGVTKGAVYYWFADKDDLGRELQQALYERLATHGLRALNPEADTITNLRRAFEVYLDAVGSLGEARFFLRDAWTIPALEEGTRDEERDAVSLLRGVLHVGVTRGEVANLDLDALAHVLFGMLAEATLHVLDTGERERTLGVIELLVESLRSPRRSTDDDLHSPAPAV